MGQSLFAVNRESGAGFVDQAIKSKGLARLRHLWRASSLYGITAVQTNQSEEDMNLGKSQQHILTYDPRRILSIWAFFMLPDLTVFHNRFHLLATLLYVGLTLLLAHLPSLLSEGEVKTNLEQSGFYYDGIPTATRTLVLRPAFE